MPFDQSDRSHGEIARDAYNIWEAEGRPVGRDLDHWAMATHRFQARGQLKRLSPCLASVVRRIILSLRWLVFHFPNRASDVPGDERAWGVITGLFALAAAPPPQQAY